VAGADEDSSGSSRRSCCAMGSARTGTAPWSRQGRPADCWPRLGQNLRPKLGPLSRLDELAQQGWTESVLLSRPPLPTRPP